MSQGVRVMNLRDDDVVSAVAVVVESEAEAAVEAVDFVDGGNGQAPLAEVGRDGSMSVDGDAEDGADNGLSEDPDAD